jgi:hypothetical protein
MNEGAFYMLEPAFAPPRAKTRNTTLYIRGLQGFPLRSSIFGINRFFFHPTFNIVYGRAKLAMKGKSVVPMSAPVSIYGYLWLIVV